MSAQCSALQNSLKTKYGNEIVSRGC